MFNENRPPIEVNETLKSPKRRILAPLVGLAALIGIGVQNNEAHAGKLGVDNINEVRKAVDLSEFLTRENENNKIFEAIYQRELLEHFGLPITEEKVEGHLIDSFERGMRKHYGLPETATMEELKQAVVAAERKRNHK